MPALNEKFPTWEHWLKKHKYPPVKWTSKLNGEQRAIKSIVADMLKNDKFTQNTKAVNLNRLDDTVVVGLVNAFYHTLGNNPMDKLPPCTDEWMQRLPRSEVYNEQNFNATLIGDYQNITQALMTHVMSKLTNDHGHRPPLFLHSQYPVHYGSTQRYMDWAIAFEKRTVAHRQVVCVAELKTDQRLSDEVFNALDRITTQGFDYAVNLSNLAGKSCGVDIYSPAQVEPDTSAMTGMWLALETAAYAHSVGNTFSILLNGNRFVLVQIIHSKVTSVSPTISISKSFGHTLGNVKVRPQPPTGSHGGSARTLADLSFLVLSTAIACSQLKERLRTALIESSPGNPSPVRRAVPLPAGKGARKR